MLRQQRIPTAELLYAGPARDGHEWLIVTRALMGVRTVREAWDAAVSEAVRQAIMTRLMRTFGQLHAAGLLHLDPHLKNFMVGDEAVFVLDGADVRRVGFWSARAERDNLALLLAQFPADCDELSLGLLDHYAQARGRQVTAEEARRLRTRLAYRRSRRLQDYLAKTQRDCTAFARTQSWQRLTLLARRFDSPALRALLADPDSALQDDSLLKRGNTATVGKVNVDGLPLVIKRYNIKSFWHGIGRAWRPSRAAHAWVNAHRLLYHGIATPGPVAMIEQRFGPLRRRAWLITEYADGVECDAYLRDPDLERGLRERTIQGVIAMIRRLGALRLAHGDLKARNFLIQDGRPWLIDLDSLREYRCASWYNGARRRDIQRFLRNWRDEPALLRQFETLDDTP